jgi:EAL domain-containing protein (putative c-di-GMP-specific phosphodiesterase class I)
MIGPLTRWVIDRAVTDSERWRGDGHDLAVAVNLSVRNLYDPNLNAWLAERLSGAGLAPGALTFEITESEVMDDPLLAMEVLGWMRRLGIATSIDDFGTGHSSLSYLKHLPIDEIKIDRSFVAGMSTDPSDETIVRSIIDLGHNLGHQVVAEGVEQAETLERLADQGCDEAQGYLISRPLPPSAVTALLERVDSWSAGVPR